MGNGEREGEWGDLLRAFFLSLRVLAMIDVDIDIDLI